MDADLCRRAGQVVNTPYYRYAKNNNPDLDEQFSQSLLESGKFENLDDNMQQFFELCERSWEIAQDLKIKNWMNPDSLEKIIDRLTEEQPTERAEEEE